MPSGLSRRPLEMSSFYDSHTLIETEAAISPPEHGGHLRAAAARYAITLDQWLDLSTGLNPHPWPVTPPALSSWARLPEDGDGLEHAAAAFYGAANPLPLPGSQAAIQALPRLRAPSRVGVPALGYREHAYHWSLAGHEVVELPEGDPGALLDAGRGALDCLVVINPNNPTGQRWPVETLLEWRERLAARGGWLIVDEAFMDVTPEHSLAPHVGLPGLVLLRSLGKFFGLAGARVGFLWAGPGLRGALRHWLGPWALSGPAREVARRALEDHRWHQEMRTALPLASARLARLLSAHGLAPSGGSALFQWVMTSRAEALQEMLAHQGIWVRCFTQCPSIRFGLPGREDEWQRLEQALSHWRSEGA